MYCITNISDLTKFRQLEVGKEYEVIEEFTTTYKKEVIPMIRIKEGIFKKDMFSDSPLGKQPEAMNSEPPKPVPTDWDLPF